MFLHFIVLCEWCLESKGSGYEGYCIPNQACQRRTSYSVLLDETPNFLHVMPPSIPVSLSDRFAIKLRKEVLISEVSQRSKPCAVRYFISNEEREEQERLTSLLAIHDLVLW